jgi:hypothetical protein
MKIQSPTKPISPPSSPSLLRILKPQNFTDLELLTKPLEPPRAPSLLMILEPQNRTDLNHFHFVFLVNLVVQNGLFLQFC